MAKQYSFTTHFLNDSKKNVYEVTPPSEEPGWEVREVHKSHETFYVLFWERDVPDAVPDGAVIRNNVLYP